MIIIVDAYNLLRAVPPYKKTITDKERSLFIHRLGAYARRKGHKIVLVFDGGPYGGPLKESMKAVLVIYSGVHESADDYIKEYIQKNRAKDLLLVTSDTELNRFAAHLQIPSIDSSSFNQLVYDELRGNGKQVAEHKNSNVVKFAQENKDLDDLMIQAIKSVPVKSEDVSVADKGRGTKKAQLGKEERALLKKLNKL